MEFKFAPVEPPKPPRPQIGKLEDEFVEPYLAWKQKATPQTRSAFLTQLHPVISAAVRSYAGAETGPSVQSQARLMALRSLDSYDPTKGPLKTHLLSQLQGLRRVSAQTQQIISLPERVALDRQHILTAEKELVDELGRPPSDMELARHAGISRKRLAYIRQSAAPVNSGRLQGAMGDPINPAVRIPGDTPAASMWEEMVYRDLDPTNQFIMERSLGLNGHTPVATADLAKKLGISAAAISQRKAKIQQLLDQRFETTLFGD